MMVSRFCSPEYVFHADEVDPSVVARLRRVTLSQHKDKLATLLRKASRTFTISLHIDMHFIFLVKDVGENSIFCINTS